MELEGCNLLPSPPAEKGSPEGASLGHMGRQMSAESEKNQKGKNASGENGWKFIDVVSNRNVKLLERVIIPVRQHPKFNFIGKLLGPRGNSLKRLKEETGTKLSILGKGSMRDRDKEEDLRKSGEAKYAHLNEDLHVLIEVFAPPSQAYRRMGHALDEVKKYLVPDYNDEIRQQQLRELSFLKGEDDAESVLGVHGRGGHARGHPASMPLPPMRALPSLPHALASSRVLHSAASRRLAAPRGPPLARALPPPLSVGKAAPVPPRARPGPVYRALPPPPPPPLAQEAYEEDYAYEDVYENGYEEEYGGGSISQTNSAEEYCDYSYTLTLGEYDEFGQNVWSNTNGHLKAAPVWSMKGANREHPYGIY